MCRKTPTSVQAEERHFSGKTSKTKVHRNLGCVDCPDISRVSPLSLKELTLKLVVLILLVSGQRG